MNRPAHPVPSRLMQLTRAIIVVFVAAFALAQLIEAVTR